MFKRIVFILIAFVCVFFVSTGCSMRQKDTSGVEIDYKVEAVARQPFADGYKYAQASIKVKNSKQCSIFDVYIYYEIENKATGELAYGEKKIIDIDGLVACEEKEITLYIDEKFDPDTHFARITLLKYSEK